MEILFTPVDYSYYDFNEKNVIRVVGKTKSGKKICLIDEYEPNFYAILEDNLKDPIEKITKKISDIKLSKKQRQAEVTKTSTLKKKFLGKEVTAIRVFVKNHKDLTDISKEVSKIKGIDKTREFDIPLITKYIKERHLEPLQWYSLDVNPISEEEFGGVQKSIPHHCFRIKKIIKRVDYAEHNLKTLAIDIETKTTDIGKGEILSISLYSKNYSKVLSWKHDSNKKFVESLSSEKEMILRFIEEVKSFDPDILTGYFSDGFDLPFIYSRAKKFKIKFALGIDNSEPAVSRGRIPSVKIFGITHIDSFRFIRSVFSQYMDSENLSLNEVAKELLGEEKLEFDFSKFSFMEEKDWEDLFDYNLQDSKVAFNLLMKIWPDIVEFSLLIKEPLFEITRNSMSANVESYLIHNIDRFNEIVEKRPSPDEISKRRMMPPFEGAFVLEPKPGIYENIAMFDFTSMYPSVIITYNLSKSTYLGGNKFSKKKGFFPELLEEVLKLRKIHKKEYSRNPTGMLKARSNAYKLLANASYGYQAYFGARYYCYEAAAATARLARENIKETIKKIKKAGFEVIYSDTDSIAFLIDSKKEKEIKEFLRKLNSKLPGMLELDLEDFYKRGIFVSQRSGQAGAKKKYALISKSGKIKIRGFETVRRDWCLLARKLQNKVIEEILKTGNEKSAISIIKEVVKKLKERKIDKKDLIIKTQLRKNTQDYLSKGPHVIAAEKMKKIGKNPEPGTIIEYYIGETNQKRKKISEGVFLPFESAKYDIDYYLYNQIIPSIENILEVFDINAKELIESKKQTKLEEF